LLEKTIKDLEKDLIKARDESKTIKRDFETTTGDLAKTTAQLQKYQGD